MGNVSVRRVLWRKCWGREGASFWIILHSYLTDPRPLLSMHPGSLTFELPEVLILRFNNDAVFFHSPPEPGRRRRLPSTAKHETRHRDDGAHTTWLNCEPENPSLSWKQASCGRQAQMLVLHLPLHLQRLTGLADVPFFNASVEVLICDVPLSDSLSNRHEWMVVNHVSFWSRFEKRFSSRIENGRGPSNHGFQFVFCKAHELEHICNHSVVFNNLWCDKREKNPVQVLDETVIEKHYLNFVCRSKSEDYRAISV